MAGLLLSLVFACGASVDEQGTAVAELLHEAAPATPQEVDRLGLRLRALGGDALDELFRAYWTHSIPSAWTQAEEDAPLHAGARQAVGQALELGPEEQLRALFQSLCLAGYELDQRVAALELLSARPIPGALDYALVLGAPPDPERPLPRSLRAGLAQALSSILDSSPGAGPVLRTRYSALGTALLPIVLSALEELEPDSALEELAACLNQRPALDVIVLRSMERVARGAPLPAADHVRSAVREQLALAQGANLVLAANICGHLADPDAVSALIEVLGRGDANQRRAAHGALRALSGMDHGTDARAWDQWHARELAFWRGPGPGLLRRLPDLETLEMGDAIRELAHYRLYRAELASALVKVLDHREEGIRVLACAALGTLGAPGVRHEVEALLVDESELVRQTAEQVLAQLAAESRPSSS